jgi:hypothetical protein
MKTLVVIIGPPAVGKLAVGRALEELTGLPLFHNHISIEAVLPFFEFGSPPFARLVGNFRQQIFHEVAAGDGPGLIFTWMWDFDDDADRAFIDGVKSIFEDHGGRTVFVELWADLQTRLARNRTDLRLREKPSKRDVEKSETRLLAAEQRYRLNSNGEFPFPDHLYIDNSVLSPADVARQVARRFLLPTIDQAADA